jgi:hypothetical protein
MHRRQRAHVFFGASLYPGISVCSHVAAVLLPKATGSHMCSRPYGQLDQRLVNLLLLLDMLLSMLLGILLMVILLVLLVDMLLVMLLDIYICLYLYL